LISGFLSELTLKGITAIRHEPPRLFAGTPTLVRIDLENTKRWFMSLSVEVSEFVGPESALTQRRGFILTLPPGETGVTHLRIASPRRGLTQTAGLRIATRFPFGFFEKSRYVPLPGQYIVYPALHATVLPPLPPTIAGAEEEIGRAGAGDEYYALRDGHSRDDARSIAWKATARRDKLIVRENQRPAARRLMITVANLLPAGPDEARADLERGVEQAIARAASLATACADSGYAVGILTGEGLIRPDTGSLALTAIYEHLARLPLRTVPVGTDLPSSHTYNRRNTIRIGVASAAQQAAGLTPEADQLVLIEADEQASATPAAEVEP
ncbi:MAG: DUF58 domain-containing protein, partial [Myxococcota bacterium]|nr:DUF58 domain-containing protein [Myxococcota bacterium]